jgi:hypothetical protein
LLVYRVVSHGFEMMDLDDQIPHVNIDMLKTL